MGSSSPTRGQARAPCIGSKESYPLDHQGSPLLPAFSSTPRHCRPERFWWEGCYQLSLFMPLCLPARLLRQCECICILTCTHSRHVSTCVPSNAFTNTYVNMHGTSGENSEEEASVGLEIMSCWFWNLICLFMCSSYCHIKARSRFDLNCLSGLTLFSDRH